MGAPRQLRGGEDNLTARDVAIEYDAKKEELKIASHAVRVPLRDGVLKLHLFVDRTAVELFAADGLVYAPVPAIPKSEDTTLSFQVLTGWAQIGRLSLDGLRSIWKG